MGRGIRIAAVVAGAAVLGWAGLSAAGVEWNPRGGGLTTDVDADYVTVTRVFDHVGTTDAQVQAAVDRFAEQVRDVVAHGSASDDASLGYARTVHDSEAQYGRELRGVTVAHGEVFAVEGPKEGLVEHRDADAHTVMVAMQVSYTSQDSSAGEPIESSLGDWHVLELVGEGERMRVVSDTPVDPYHG